MTTDWRRDAACRDTDPELYFPLAESRPGEPPSAGERMALAVCHRCPVLEQCAGWAMAAGEVSYGVLGGLTAAQRRDRRRTSRREVAA